MPPIASQSSIGFQVGLHPIADSSVASDALDMQANQFSPSAKLRTAKGKIQTAGVDLNESKKVAPPSPEAVARRAYAIYENQGSPAGGELKHWLEAEAQLFGGIERESQMHPGSSLFVTEH